MNKPHPVVNNTLYFRLALQIYARELFLQFAASKNCQQINIFRIRMFDAVWLEDKTEYYKIAQHILVYLFFYI